MNRRASISIYTPSNSDPVVLESIFVQRHKILERIVKRLAYAILNKENQHALLIGPRGSGKTLLVTLAVHRLKERFELSNRMRICWLGEDSTITGLIDLALGMLDQLAESYPDELSNDFKNEVKKLSPDEAADSILNYIVKSLGDRHCLLIIENLNTAFEGLGDIGQKKFRAFLQESQNFSSLTTSQQLFSGVEKRDKAFFGFFDIQHLKPLSVKNALELIRAIAKHQGNDELYDYLGTPEGRYRVRAIHHLAGGNHRMYVLLSEFLSKDSLEDLVEAFEGLAEELTPYFQERVRSLSPQQAKLVQFLANTEGAMSVKQISEESFVAENSCSKQLGELKKMCYVRSSKKGKESYYELEEPILRLSIESKNQRGRPLKLIARFLKAWFPDSGSNLNTKFSQQISPRIEAYMIYAKRLDTTYEKDISKQLQDEIALLYKKGKTKDIPRLTAELRIVDFKAAELFDKHNRFDELGEKKKSVDKKNQDTVSSVNIEQALANYTARIELEDAPVDQVALALYNRGVTHGQLKDLELAISDFSTVIELEGAPVDLVALALNDRGIAYWQLNNHELAASDFSAVIELEGAPVDQVAKALYNRGIAYGKLNNHELAASDFSAVIELEGASVDQVALALNNHGIAYWHLNNTERALSDYSAVIELEGAPVDQVAKALYNRGMAYWHLNNTERALSDYSAVIELEGAPVDQVAKALNDRGTAYWYMNNHKQAASDLSAVIELEGAPVDQVALALSNLGSVYWMQGRYTESEVTFQRLLDSDSIPREFVDKGLFAIVEPMIITNGFDAAFLALETAFNDSDKDSEHYGGTPDDLLRMVIKLKASEWSQAVEKLAQLYNQNGVIDKLGRGLVQLLSDFSTGEYSNQQLSKWNESWQAIASEYDDLELPLRCLDAGIQVIQTGDDRALFQLPLELRSIVEPLLAQK